MTAPTPNGQTGELICPLTTCFGCPDPVRCDALRRGDQPAPSQRDLELAAALNEQRRQSYNAETLRTRPAPRSDTPSDERHPGYPHQPGEPLTLDLTVDLARPAPSPVPEASGRGEVVQPTMHILRRADGEEMGEFAFWATDGPDGWDMAEDNDHDEDTVYEILACYPVARRKILWSTLCETCDGEGDGCPACAGSGECEPPDAEHMPIIARPAPSSSPDPARYVSPVCRDGSHQACANFRGTCRCTCHAAAGEGTGRPGGWVRCKNGDEFWVASFTDMGEADEIRSGANVGPARRWLGSWSGPSLGDLVIVTRWADGTVPAPASPQRPQADEGDEPPMVRACVACGDSYDECVERLRCTDGESACCGGCEHPSLRPPLAAAAALPVPAQRPQASEAVDRLDGWLRATHDGSCRICGMGSEYVDQHAADCEAAPVIALALAGAAALPVRDWADDEFTHVAWLKTMPEWINLAYALAERDRLFGAAGVDSLDRTKADAKVANMAVRLADALPRLLAADPETGPHGNLLPLPDDVERVLDDLTGLDSETVPVRDRAADGSDQWVCFDTGDLCSHHDPHPGCRYVDRFPGPAAVADRGDLESILDDLQGGKHFDAEATVERLLAADPETGEPA